MNSYQLINVAYYFKDIKTIRKLNVIEQAVDAILSKTNNVQSPVSTKKEEPMKLNKKMSE